MKEENKEKDEETTKNIFYAYAYLDIRKTITHTYVW